MLFGSFLKCFNYQQKLFLTYWFIIQLPLCISSIICHIKKKKKNSTRSIDALCAQMYVYLYLQSHSLPSLHRCCLQCTVCMPATFNSAVPHFYSFLYILLPKIVGSKLTLKTEDTESNSSSFNIYKF